MAADRAFAGVGGCTTVYRKPLYDPATAQPAGHIAGGSDQRRFRQVRMKNDQARREGKASADTKDPRRDRLKAALRENLKRRKSQARGRDDLGAASSERTDASLDDAGEKKPGQ
jgi:hypothetical protein